MEALRALLEATFEADEPAELASDRGAVLALLARSLDRVVRLVPLGVAVGPVVVLLQRLHALADARLVQLREAHPGVRDRDEYFVPLVPQPGGRL